MKAIERPAGMSDEDWKVAEPLAKVLHPCIEGGTAEVKEGLLTNTRWLISLIIAVVPIVVTGIIYVVVQTSHATVWITGVNSSLAILAGDHQELDELKAAVKTLQGTANATQATANSTQQTSRNTNRLVGGPNSTNGPTQ